MDAIIFDVDGTLWDSTAEVAKAWNQVLESCPQTHIRVTEDWLRREFGQPMDVIMAHLFPDMKQDEKSRIVPQMFAQENKRVAQGPCRIYDGVLEMIPELYKSYQLFIVSNCQGGYIEAFLENTGLDKYIAEHLCPDDTGLMKAANIRYLLDKYNIKDAVYVGDTQGDADACTAADIPMIYVSYGFGEVKKPKHIIHSFRELYSYVSHL